MRLLLVELERHFPQLTELAPRLAKELGYEVEFAREVYAPSYSAFSASRGQWDGEHLLRELSAAFKHAPYSVVLAFFPHDLHAKGYKRVFGVAENDGKAALVSYYYLNPALHGAPNDALFKERLLKKSLHELGHALGLPHCVRKHCVMNFSRTLMFLDRKPAAFCESCRFLVAPVKPALSLD